jgi:hypothetical protein
MRLSILAETRSSIASSWSIRSERRLIIEENFESSRGSLAADLESLAD